MDRGSETTAPVAVIGAGPVGLAAAAHLAARDQAFVVLEGGATVAAHVRAWGHVRTFSPWRYDVDPEAARLLGAGGWTPPDPEHLPTGHELVEQYLEPLASLPAIRPHLRLGWRVLAVSRLGHDKLTSAARADSPFLLRVRTASGERDLLARAVIDASGTYGSPNPLGGHGLPARGEAAVAERVFYGIPDILGRHRDRYAGRAVLVVGSGHSAFNALTDLVALGEEAPGVRITWLVRHPLLDRQLGGGVRDALPARGALGLRTRALLTQGRLRLAVGRLAELAAGPEGIVATGDDGARLAVADQIVAVTGFRPDLRLLGELRVALDPVVEAPAALGPLVDPNLHGCGTVPPHGARELAQPEPGLYVVGMKSYGRAPTFLMRTGYEQVRSVVAALAGDHDAAARVDLVLPETGVCVTDPPGDAVVGPAASCCGTQAGGSTTLTGARLARPRVDRRLAVVPTPAPAPGGCCEGG